MDSDEKLVEDRFAGLASALAQVVVAPPAARIRARGDRRRTRLITGSALVAVAAAVLIGLSGIVGPGLINGPTVQGTDDSPVLAIPPSFRLGYDGQAGWTRQTDRTAPSIFQPCGGSTPEPADPTLAGRLDAITATGPSTGGGSISKLSEQLLLFRDADASGAAVTALIAQKDRCGWNVSADSYDGTVGGSFDADVLTTGRLVPASGSMPAHYEGATVLRRGNALWIRFELAPDATSVWYVDGPNDVRGQLCSALHLCLR